LSLVQDCHKIVCEFWPRSLSSRVSRVSSLMSHFPQIFKPVQNKNRLSKSATVLYTAEVTQCRERDTKTSNDTWK